MNARKIVLLITLTMGALLVHGQDADIDYSSRTEIQLLDGEIITITLSGDQFVREGELSPLGFTLMNAPPGLSITSADATSFTTAELTLVTTDFDIDYNYFHIIILDSLLDLSGYLETDTCVLTANVERAVLTSFPMPLTEHNIGSDGNSAYLDINLNGTDYFTSNGNDLVLSDLTLINFPAGVEKDHIDYGSPTTDDKARLYIKYDPSLGEFDGDIANAALTINAGDLQYSTDTLGTDTLFIRAFTESLSFNAGLSSNLDEEHLDQGVVVVDLDNDQTSASGSLNVADLGLVNFPAGTSIQSASSDGSRTRITINLEFDGTDFDYDDTDGQVRVDGSILTWNKTSDLLTPSGEITITPTPPSASITGSSWLREYFLDTMSLHLTLNEEEFDPGETLSAGDFGFQNAPGGLEIEGVTDRTSTTVSLLLRFDGTDFDNAFNNVRVTIDQNVLVFTSSGELVTDPFSIDPNIEPVVSGVSIPNTSMKIGDPVLAIISLLDYNPDSAYTLAGGTIGGYPLASLQKLSANQYRAGFTVTEGGNDYLASQSIPVSNLRLNDPPVPGVNYNGNIVQGNDLLDANRPVVSSLHVIGQGDKQIGDEVVLLISAFEEGLLTEDSTVINHIAVTASNVTFEEIGGGSYSLIYTVEGGDADVAPGTLTAKVYLRDEAGNINTAYPGIASNTLSIDASVPVISSMTNTTPSDTVIIGGEVILTIVADGSGYSLSDDSEVNGVKKTEGLLFSSAGATYTLRYPVKDGDPTVAAGDLKARIVLADPSGNRSVPDSVILANDVAVLTQRPTALLTGNPEICINDTAVLYITLGGAAPWRVKYNNTVDSYYIEDIAAANYTLKISPTQTLGYSIDSVWDGTGNSHTGSGNSVVIVNPLPDVSIIDLKSQFGINEDPIILQGNPYGGSFSGPGVNSVTGEFNPSAAGLSGDQPHWIYFAYTDANNCFNVDSQAVSVLKAKVEFDWPNETYRTACYFDETYTLRATNLSGTIGKFKLDSTETYPAGFMTDNGDNSATFRPSILEWESGTEVEILPVKIYYKYLNENGTGLSTDTILDIEYSDTATIDELSSYEYCSNNSVVALSGTKSINIVFSGSGVVYDEGNSAYLFDPGEADIGENRILYTYTSPRNCIQRDSAFVTVYPAPVPAFSFIDSCVVSGGDTVRFMNITDTTGLGGTLEWTWVYGDNPSGDQNRDVFSTMQNGLHPYPGPGLRTVSLTAEVLETECMNTSSITKEIGNTPDVGIEWNSECYTGDPVQFTGISETEDVDSVFIWKITDMSGEEIGSAEGSDVKSLAYQFDTRDNYSLEFTSVTNTGCQATARDTLYLRPYIRNITDDAPYTEDFEEEAAGWYSFAGESSPQESWKLGNVDPGQFPYDLPGDGSRAWYTDLVRKDTVEQSWVSSPCFDFSQMRRPMISFDRKISSDRNFDGTVLQYTYDDGGTWHNVGAVDDGRVNWYNTFRIQNGPGDQSEGWTGDFVFEKFEPWKQSRHDLDELTGRARVQFRIAYGSSGTSVYENEGFAFDNVWIGERSRVVLIEHFTNSGMQESNMANERVNRLVRNYPLDVIDVQYHAEVSGYADLMNLDNPAPASARSLFYGTRDVPYMLIDGGGDGGLLAYDFSENDLDTLDLFTRTLTDPFFSIGLDVTEASGKLDIGIDLEALDTLPNAEYIVYTVILEKLIDDPAYTGSGASVFENVVRAMVPNAAGVSLLRAWNPGDTESIPLSWTLSDKILNTDVLTVVVFVQDAGDRMIYQAASNDEDLNGEPVIHTSVADMLASRSLSLLLYPNPASDRVYLAFAESSSHRIEIQLFSNTGTLVGNEIVKPGTEVYELELGGLESGIYLVRAMLDGKVIGIRRLLLMR